MRLSVCALLTMKIRIWLVVSNDFRNFSGRGLDFDSYIVEGVVSWFCLHSFWSSSLTSSNLIFLIHMPHETNMQNAKIQVSQFFSLCFNQPLGPWNRRKPPDSQRRRTVDMPGPREQGWGMNIYNIYIYNIYIYIYTQHIYIYTIYTIYIYTIYTIYIYMYIYNIYIYVYIYV